jgi:surfactin synthase thioesterase subunit
MNNEWIIAIKESNFAKTTVLCFHHAGGSASFFRKFSKYIGNNLNLYSVQLPGRGKRFTERFVENVDDVVMNVSKHYTFKTDNLIIFGHSLGALLAYEFSKFLCNNKIIIPRHLIVSGRNAPSEMSKINISNLSDDELLNYLREIGDMPEEVYSNSEVLKVFLPIIKSDLKISDSYIYRGIAKLPHPITAYIGKADQSINLSRIDCWARETTSNFNKIIFEGGHFYLSKNLDLVMNNLNQLINQYN